MKENQQLKLFHKKLEFDWCKSFRYDPPPRDRYYGGYERRPPPPEYDRYERPRTAASDPYYRERAAIGSRPPPDYYSRR